VSDLSMYLENGKYQLLCPNGRASCFAAAAYWVGYLRRSNSTIFDGGYM
jgi:hypothetical protein